MKLPRGAKWAGPEEMIPFLVPVKKLSTHPSNPRRGDVARIADSLRRFGQMRAIPFQRSTGHIVAGNHTYRAAVEEVGWTHIAAIPADLDDDEALAYVIADNRTADVAVYDDAILAETLTRLLDAGKIAGTGFTADEIDDELARIRALPVTTPEEFTGGYSETDAALAARQAARAAAPIMREVVLMYDPETYVRFGALVKILQNEYGTKGTIETVYRAVEIEAKRVNTEGGET